MSNPSLHAPIKRSFFPRSHGHKTTFNAGELVPIFIDEILPGDTFVSRGTSFVLRQSTLIKPVMDDANLDVWFFYVPSRILFDDWKKLMGELDKNCWRPSVPHEVPQVRAPKDTGWLVGTIAERMGIVPGKTGFEVSVLPFRAYCMIWNEWFRDQNLQSATMFMTDENATIDGSNGSDYLVDPVKGGMPLPVNKYHDYFTSALPSPQKGKAADILSDININFGPDAVAPVSGQLKDFPSGSVNSHSLNFSNSHSSYASLFLNPSSSDSSSSLFASEVSGPSGNRFDIYPTNLGADLSKLPAGSVTSSSASFSVNDVRMAFAIQRMLERSSRGGTRYTEVLRSQHNVNPADSRLQRPEFIAGFRKPISARQVYQTSSTDSVSPQANLSAYSVTSAKRGSFTKSFVEHGFLIGVAAVRTIHTYQQGIEKFWFRRHKFDFYWPVFANIGEQPILNKEIFVSGDIKKDNEVFGYQEAWADYRYKPSRVSGHFRSSAKPSLDVWHYGDNYADTPVLCGDWVSETKVNIDRTLFSDSSVSPQFFADFYFDLKCARNMPVYSIPGNIDRN